MKPKPGFTVARHEEIGAALHPMRDFLLALSCETSRSFPHNSPQVRAATTALNAISNLQSKLDDAVCHDHRGHKRENGKPLSTIYYR
ncbi:MAG: hypothetical protein V1797_06230 [Pseudomonadota bacterium]